MEKRIVEQTIKRMKVPEENSRIEWDAEIPGFGVRITAAGVTSFILDYRTRNVTLSIKTMEYM